MTRTPGIRRIMGRCGVSAVGLAMALGLAACGGGEGESQQSDGGGAASAAPAAKVTDRIQLTEEVPYSLDSGRDPVSLQISGYEDNEDPAVLIDVQRGGETQHHSLHLGDTLKLNGRQWQVSGIGLSGSAAIPGTATLVPSGTGTSGQ